MPRTIRVILIAIFALAAAVSAADPPLDPRRASSELRESRVRLDAHRRELARRDRALRAAERRIADLVRKLRRERAVAKRSARDAAQLAAAEKQRDLAKAEAERYGKRAAELEAELRAREAAPPPPPYAPPPALEPASPEESELVASLRHDLDLERENRKTLEAEIQRLLAERGGADVREPLTRSLAAANAEILLLRDRLQREERDREALEVLVARARSAANVEAGADWIDRFETTMRERQQQAQRLRAELSLANESIVALKAKIESAPPPAAPVGEAATAELRSENDALRLSLRAAEQANADLRTQAELAARLADMLYGEKAPH